MGQRSMIFKNFISTWFTTIIFCLMVIVLITFFILSPLCIDVVSYKTYWIVYGCSVGSFILATFAKIFINNRKMYKKIKEDGFNNHNNWE